MKKPAGYSGPYTPPSANGATGAFVSPTEVYDYIRQGAWPPAYPPGEKVQVEIGEIVSVLATGVIDNVNATGGYSGSLVVASGGVQSRTGDANLYAKYGTRFGTGDGSNTFNVISVSKNYPYLVGETASGLTYPTAYQVQSLIPDHTHTITVATGVYSTLGHWSGNGFPAGSAQGTYTTNNNDDETDINEGRHQQVIYCLTTKTLPEPPVGSVISVLCPNAQGSDINKILRLTVPANYLVASGQAVNRSEFATLFNRVGTLYGSGDGSNTFNLPNFNGLFLRASSSNNFITVSGSSTNASGYLSSATARHVHTRANVYYTSGGDNTPTGGGFYLPPGNTPSSTSSVGGSETRHRNLTVLYYVVASGSI